MLFGTIDTMKPDREPDFLIGPPDDPYMERWFLIPRNPEFNVYYHRIRHDDDDRALHDHPWASISIMCHGQLEEIVHDDDRLIGSRIVTKGDVVFRSPLEAHRLKIVDGPAETLFITGPRVREWGFHCPKGWVDWRDFVGENPGEVGRGCGEMA